MNRMAQQPAKRMLITTRQKRQNIQSSLPPLSINANIMEEVQSHKDLGVIVDNNFLGYFIFIFCVKNQPTYFSYLK